MGKEGTHSGHRKRVRMEFFENGFSPNTPTQKIVEMMLYYAVPRKDTNNTAHALVERFGTISGILDASKDELIKVGRRGMHRGVFENDNTDSADLFSRKKRRQRKAYGQRRCLPLSYEPIFRLDGRGLFYGNL